MPFFCGICGGIGDYTGIDPTLIRLGWTLFCVMGGSGIPAYVIAAIIIPERPEY
ncbi:MAG: PspC domain-containing protein [Coprococcus sp.]